MAHKLVRVEDYVRITVDGQEIYAHWNGFKTFDEAVHYFENDLVKVRGAKYGLVKVKKDLWEFVK